ncbi:hypothetical protein JD969_18605 [Planctomycetota bacterium]|nr:hypothetical protein JD969_18605 [Planctomycetota bacterium]
MSRICQYCTTDFDFDSAIDPTEFSNAFEVNGSWSYYMLDNSSAPFTTTIQSIDDDNPIKVIEAFLTAIESLPPAMRDFWSQCENKVIDIAYDCTSGKKSTNQNLSSDLIKRIADIGCDLRFTVYPSED